MARLLDSIVGHSEQIQKLCEAIEKSRLAPVLLFVGPAGIGKKRVALALAQTLVCENSNKACGTCGSCIRIEKASSEALILISPQGTQIKIEQTRELQNQISLRSVAKNRIVIIDDADKINIQAANSLLKTLEEPPENTYFFLISQSLSSALPTIRSRSQIVRFSPLKTTEIKKLSSAPDWAVISSQGQMNRLENLTHPEFEQLRQSLHEVFHSTKEGNARRAWAFALLKELATDRETALQMIGLWQQYVRDLTFLVCGTTPLIHADKINEYKDLAHLAPESMDFLNQKVLQAERDILGNIDRTLVLENLWNDTKKALVRPI